MTTSTSTARTTHALPLPRHVRVATDQAILAAIRAPAVTLAIWQRPPPPVGALTRVRDIRFSASVAAVDGRLAATVVGPRPRWLAAVMADVAMLARRYAEVTGVDEVEVRLDRIDGNACWRFHTDYVAVRLIATYAGRGTEWLPQGAQDGDPPQALACGDVGLFKGRLLAGDDAIIHRSPPIAGSGQERLLLVIDAAPVDRD